MATENHEQDLDKLVLEFKWERDTKRTSVFQEQLGEQSYSEKDVAIGPIYIQREALEMIGKPEKVRITVEPLS